MRLRAPAWDKVILLNPKRAGAYFERGKIHLLRKRFEKRSTTSTRPSASVPRTGNATTSWAWLMQGYTTISPLSTVSVMPSFSRKTTPKCTAIGERHSWGGTTRAGNWRFYEGDRA